jgi:hypothetical protein
MFVSTVEENLETTYGNISLVDELIMLKNDKLINWRERLSKQFKALVDRDLLDEYVSNSAKQLCIALIN